MIVVIVIGAWKTNGVLVDVKSIPFSVISTSDVTVPPMMEAWSVGMEGESHFS